MDAPNENMEVQRHTSGDDSALSNQQRGPVVQGVVKWFSNAKGYGFICCEHYKGDIFAHFSAITSDGYKTLRKGQPVRFELVTGPKGSFATNIEPIETAGGQSGTPSGVGPHLAGQPNN